MNRSLLLSTSFILIVLSSCALAQTVTVSPSTVIPGEPLFVRIQGQFPTPCSLDVTQLETRVENQLLEVRLIIAEEPCPQVIAELDQSFGAFTLDADQFAADKAACRSYAHREAEDVYSDRAGLSGAGGVNNYVQYNALMQRHDARRDARIQFERCLMRRGYRKMDPNAASKNI